MAAPSEIAPEYNVSMDTPTEENDYVMGECVCRGITYANDGTVFDVRRHAGGVLVTPVPPLNVTDKQRVLLAALGRAKTNPERAQIMQLLPKHLVSMLMATPYNIGNKLGN
jgi:hypothetical protein